MESFMSRYLKDDEIKKHGLSRTDLLFIIQEYQVLEKMLEQYESSIFNKKEQSEKLIRELANGQKIAKLLSFLGKTYADFLSTAEVEVLSCVDSEDDVWDSCLHKNLSGHYFETMNFIIYLLSRQHRNYQLYCIHEEFRDALKYGLGYINVMASETDSPIELRHIDDCKDYLNQLYAEQIPFILTVDNDDCNGNFYYRKLYGDNEVLFDSKKVAILGGSKYKTICFLGDDDVFKEIMTKLMLFSQLHGFCAKDIDHVKSQEDYAQAVESMDVSSYSMEISKKSWPNYFTLSKKM